MKMKNIDEAAGVIRQYLAVSEFIEASNSENAEKIMFQAVSPKTMGIVSLMLPWDTAETLLFTEKNRLERELAGLGVEV